MCPPRRLLKMRSGPCDRELFRIEGGIGLENSQKDRRPWPMAPSVWPSTRTQARVTRCRTAPWRGRLPEIVPVVTFNSDRWPLRVENVVAGPSFSRTSWRFLPFWRGRGV